MTFESLYEICPTDDDAGLWAAQQLVTGEAHQVYSGRYRSLNRWLRGYAKGRAVDQRATAKILNHRNIV